MLLDISNIKISRNNFFVNFILKHIVKKHALVIWSNIYCLREFLCPALIAHELVHIEQFKRYGFLGLIIRYLYQHYRYGYLNNMYEVQARAEADKFIEYAREICEKNKK